MSDDIVKALLKSLTEEQKQNLIQSLLDSNVKSDEPLPNKQKSSEPEPKGRAVKEDFTVFKNDNLEKRKTVVRARKNEWIDEGEFKDNEADYSKFEKMKTPRRRGKPKKRDVECHVCGKTFSVSESIVFGEYTRCNRCTGR